MSNENWQNNVDKLAGLQGGDGSPPAPPRSDVPPAAQPASPTMSNYYGDSNLGTPVDPYVPPRVNFLEAIQLGFKGYVIWNARSTRAEFWWWVLANFLALLVLSIISGAINSDGALVGIFLLATFIPNISIQIRRFHDTDRSGGWYWIGLIPIVGVIIQLVFFCDNSSPTATRWNRSLAKELQTK